MSIDDRELVAEQNGAREKNHIHSSRSKHPRHAKHHTIEIHVGDVVYLRKEKDKHSTRCQYLVVAVDEPWCTVQKFVGSQLRSAEYKVYVSECYRVPTESVPHPSDTDSDTDFEDIGPDDYVVTDPPPEIAAPPQNITPSPSNSRPARRRQQPKWMQSDEWVFN